MAVNKCYFCKEEHEIGKKLFWCPRLRAYHNSCTYYGSWVCLKCCKNQFYENIYNKNLGPFWVGSCAECDFPVGAILNAKEFYGVPQNINAQVIKQGDSYYLSPELSIHKQYYGFYWDLHQKRLRLTECLINEGVASLVLNHNKLPTRKVILLEDTLYYDPLSWGELNRYYWSSYGAQQHFREEVWMDMSPVIICSGYLSKDGFVLDEKFKKKIEYLKQQFTNEREKIEK